LPKEGAVEANLWLTSILLDAKLLYGYTAEFKKTVIFQVIYELGCRVGEFVRIQAKHFNFNQSTAKGLEPSTFGSTVRNKVL